MVSFCLFVEKLNMNYFNTTPEAINIWNPLSILAHVKQGFSLFAIAGLLTPGQKDQLFIVDLFCIYNACTIFIISTRVGNEFPSLFWNLFFVIKTIQALIF